MKMKKYTKIGIGILCLFLGACSDKDGGGDREASASVQRVNKFIYTYFDAAYLWNTEIPRNIDIRYETNSFDYFDKLVYSPDDRWSYLTDKAEALFENYEGVETTFGYDLRLGEFTNTHTYFAILTHVYAGSPAEKAGLKRGDLLVKIDGEDITEGNYRKLFDAAQIRLQLGKLQADGIALTEQVVEMKAVKTYLDPVVADKVIERGTKRIGYLCYTGFNVESHVRLVDIFRRFKEQGVTDVVLDLRYNPGGAAVTARYLSSMLVPASVLNQEAVFLREIWNDDYMDYYRQQGIDVNQYFDSGVPVNMDLNRLYVLTTGGTASASEATMVGLSSYLDVIKIGTPTHGKYCGAMLVQPLLSNGKPDPEIENWAMSLIVYRFANKDGVTDFKNGFVPDYQVEDDLFHPYPLGDESDPHLAKALELITGQGSVPASRLALPVNFPYRMLPVDKAKRTPLQGLLLDYRF